MLTPSKPGKFFSRVSLVDGFVLSPRVAWRTLSVASCPLKDFLAYASQTSKGCDERSIDCQLDSSSCKARIVRGEIAGEPCLLPPVHELQEQLNSYQVMTA